MTQFSAKENAKFAMFPKLHPIKTAYVCLADLDDDPLTELWTFYWPDDECS